MADFTVQLTQSVIYSIGDTHSRGREILDFCQKLETRAAEQGEHAAFVQLGDLCDGFALPEDSSIDSLKYKIRCLLSSLDKKNAIHQDVPLIHWKKYEDRRDGEVVGQGTLADILDHGEWNEIVALYEALNSCETLDGYSQKQKSDPDHFYVLSGNHDADLLRGRCRYGRQQKHLLLGLLGFRPDEVREHMLHGTPDVMLRHPWLAWMNTRPHIALSQDTAYMHGGPTRDIGVRLQREGFQGFQKWIEDIDQARTRGWDDPAFEEHASFLSPDGVANDWIRDDGESLRDFCRASQLSYIAVGHSPFLDFPKDVMLDLSHPPYRALFNTPAQLPPDGKLIKHDTDLKRSGELWACRHEVGTSVWTGICGADMTESPLRMGGNTP